MLKKQIIFNKKFVFLKKNIYLCTIKEYIMGDVSNENTEKLLKEIDNLSQRVSFLETQVFNLQDINRMLKETFVNYCNFY